MLRFTGVGGNPDNGSKVPQVPSTFMGQTMGTPMGMGAAERSHLLGGKPFTQPTVPSYEQGMTHRNINDLMIHQASQDIVQMIMTTLGETSSAYSAALPMVNMEGDTIVLTRFIFNADAPAVRAPEAPNPQLTSRTEKQVVKILQHGVSVPCESMAVATEAGMALFSAQLAQATEAFKQYFIGIMADELLRPHKPINTSGARQRPADIFGSEDALCAYMQNQAANFNIWNKHRDPLSAVCAALNSAINAQNGVHNMIIAPQKAMKISQAMQASNAFGDKTKGAPGLVPRIYESCNIPQRSGDPLAQQVQTGQFAFSEYSPLPGPQRTISVHNEANDGFSDLPLLSGILMSGQFTLDGSFNITGLTPLGQAFFRPYPSIRAFCERFNVWNDVDAALRNWNGAQRRKFAEKVKRRARGGTGAHGASRVPADILHRQKQLQEPPPGSEDAFQVLTQAFGDVFGDRRHLTREQKEVIRPLMTAVLTIFHNARPEDREVITVDGGRAITDLIGRLRKYITKKVAGKDGHMRAAELNAITRGLEGASLRNLVESIQTDDDAIQLVNELDQNPSGDTGDDDFKGLDVFKLSPAQWPSFLQDMLENDLPVPISILWARPHMQYTVEATVACQSGGGTGHSFYGHGSIEFGGNATLQNKEMTANAYFGAIVTNPNNLAVLSCSRITEYISGGGVRLFNVYHDGAEFRETGNMGDADIIPILCPPTFEPEREVLDITGSWHPSLVRSANLALHYPGADIVAGILGLRHPDAEDVRNGRVSAGNTVLWRMTQLAKTKAQRDLGVDSYEGTGPLGPFAPGVALQRRGRNGAPVAVRNGQVQTVTPWQQL